jgi:hypothetical protein
VIGIARGCVIRRVGIRWLSSVVLGSSMLGSGSMSRLGAGGVGTFALVLEKACGSVPL